MDNFDAFHATNGKRKNPQFATPVKHARYERRDSLYIEKMNFERFENELLKRAESYTMDPTASSAQTMFIGGLAKTWIRDMENGFKFREIPVDEILSRFYAIPYSPAVLIVHSGF